MSEERFLVSWYGRTAVVKWPTEIDITLADDAREALLSVLNQGAVGLVVDMTATTFCDSAGITALGRAARRATATGATMRLAAVSSPVLRVFSLVGIDRVIDIHPTVQEALASLPDQAGGLVRLSDGEPPDQQGGLVRRFAEMTRSADLHREQHRHALRA